MSWYYKIASIPIQIASYSNDGVLAVLLRDKRYEYYNVEPPTVNKLSQLIRHSNWKAAFALLEEISNKKDNQEELLF